MNKVQSQPLIAVRSVQASSRWYRHLLGLESLPQHPHREIYDRLECEGRLVLQLHVWDAEDHPNLVDPEKAPAGHGLVLWFEVADFDEAVARAYSLSAQIIEEAHVNPRALHREMWLRDLDGYVVVIASQSKASES